MASQSVRRRCSCKGSKRIDLTITGGEVTALKGPSGCGKTTLLNLLGGLTNQLRDPYSLTAPTSQHSQTMNLLILDCTTSGSFSKHITLFLCSVLRECELHHALQDRPKEERLARAEQLLKAVGLEEDKRPGQLLRGNGAWPARALASSRNLSWQTSLRRIWILKAPQNCSTLWSS